MVLKALVLHLSMILELIYSIVSLSLKVLLFSMLMSALIASTEQRLTSLTQSFAAGKAALSSDSTAELSAPELISAPRSISDSKPRKQSR